jgi:hypothetical protein
MVDINSLSSQATSKIGENAISLLHNPKVLIIGIILIVAAIIILYFLKNILLNSIVGVFGLLLCHFIGIKLPFWLTLIVSAIFGAAGLGTMLILKFLGIV